VLIYEGDTRKSTDNTHRYVLMHMDDNGNAFEKSYTKLILDKIDA